MKTKISILTLAVITSTALMFTGCAIFPQNAKSFNIRIGMNLRFGSDPYTDDEDGDISANVVVDETDVNTDEIGEYEVSYSVTDDAGNVGTTTRIVRVVMTKAAYTGIYNVHEICDMDEDGIYGEADVEFEINDYVVTISAGGDPDELIFENFGAYGVEVVVPVFFLGDLNDELLVDDYNLPGTTIYFDADGLVTRGEVGNIEFDLDYTAKDGPVIVPCQAEFVKI